MLNVCYPFWNKVVVLVSFFYAVCLSNLPVDITTLLCVFVYYNSTTVGYPAMMWFTCSSATVYILHLLSTFFFNTFFCQYLLLRAWSSAARIRLLVLCLSIFHLISSSYRIFLFLPNTQLCVFPPIFKMNNSFSFFLFIYDLHNFFQFSNIYTS